MKERKAKLKRDTKETQILMELNLDGRGKYQISTGIGFLNHMLELFTYHGGFDLKIRAKGDLEVDIHHTNEDIGITLGMAFSTALGDRKGINRYGFFYVPMGKALVRTVVDISGRPSLYLSNFPRVKSNPSYRLSDLRHFLESFVREAGINLHIDVIKSDDFHHMCEAIFKSLARAMRMAVDINPSHKKSIPSTKGKL